LISLMSPYLIKYYHNESLGVFFGEPLDVTISYCTESSLDSKATTNFQFVGDCYDDF